MCFLSIRPRRPPKFAGLTAANSCGVFAQVWFADADGQGQGSWWKAQILIDNRPEQVGLTTTVSFAVFAAAPYDKLVHTQSHSPCRARWDKLRLCAGGGRAGGPLVLWRAVGALRGAVGPGACGECIWRGNPNEGPSHCPAYLLHLACPGLVSTFSAERALLQASGGCGVKRGAAGQAEPLGAVRRGCDGEQRPLQRQCPEGRSSNSAP